MAVDPSVVINIAAEYTGNKAFKQADTAVTKLNKSVKNLAATFGVAFSVAAIVAYGKAAAKAAGDDAKAQAILATNLKNVGLAYAQLPVEQFINNMQKQTGILDDQLRPAFARLAQVTGSVQKSQELMASAFDISRGSTVDFSTVVETLSQAYIGNNKGLKKLNISMTQAELKTASFNDIMAQLNHQFAGAGKAAIATYGGQMELLAAAASDAQETIGFALLDALKTVSGKQGVEGLTENIGHLSEATALFIKLLAKPLENDGSWVNKLSDLMTKLPGFNQSVKTLAGYLDVQDIKTGYGQQSPGERNQAVAAEKAAAKRNADLKRQADLAAALAKATKKNAADALRLAKAKTIFDLSKISIEAALKGKITEEERARLLLMKAIADENISMIDKYTKALNEAQLKTKELQAALDKVQGTTFGNPFQEAFYGGLSQAQIDLEKFKESGGFRLKWDATDYYRGLTQGEVDLEKFKEKGGFRLKWDATDYYKGLTQSQVDLEKFKERGMFRLKWDATDFYRGLTAAQQALERFKEGGGFRRPDVPNPNEPTPPDSGGGNGGGGGSGDLLPMFNMPNNFDMSGLNNNPGKNNGNNSVNNVVNISAGVVGSEDIIIMAVQNALNELSRRGNSITYAGAIA